MTKMSNTYTPRPLVLNHINIPEELIALVESLAENVHDVWAEGRIAEGWTYGSERNDEKKTNPCLVPYPELPESEKEYDRNTAESTVKSILAAGFTIVRR